MRPIICGVGLGAWCVRKSPFVRGVPPKTGVVGKGVYPSRPVSGVRYDEGLAHPGQCLGWGRTE